jgi:hypothetical protein
VEGEEAEVGGRRNMPCGGRQCDQSLANPTFVFNMWETHKRDKIIKKIFKKNISEDNSNKSDPRETSKRGGGGGGGSNER